VCPSLSFQSVYLGPNQGYLYVLVVFGPNLNMADTIDSSSDEAPEEISFSSSKKQKFSQEQSIREASILKKQKAKEKRSKQNDLFRLQKQKKLSDLSSRKLPQEILNAASSPVETDERKDVKVFTSDDEGQGDGSDDEANEDRLSDSGLEDGEDDTEDFISLSTTPKWMQEAAAKEKKAKKKSGKTKKEKEKERELELKESFIGLGHQHVILSNKQEPNSAQRKDKRKRKSQTSGPVQVMTKDEVLDANLSSMQKALDFREQMLYRNRERVSYAERSAIKQRKRLRESLKKGMPL